MISNQAGDFQLVDVYRLKQPVDNVDRVLKRAPKYIRLGGSFAWEQLVLIGILRTVKGLCRESRAGRDSAAHPDRVEADSELLTGWARHSSRGIR